MNKDAARREAQTAMSSLGLTLGKVAEQAGVDGGTVSDFLSGKRWPRRDKLAKISTALGFDADHLRAVSDGSEPEQGLVIPSTDEGLMEFEVSGDFGVRVIVKGPVSNARELEQSVSRLIQDIRRSDEERDARSHG